ncbi:hypothetical protein HZS_4704 [Henneguya salminicola]|nr:hypothetical protein HZS_4704 [Henneguya salminicola]
MIRPRINLPLSLLSDAAHLIIPEQYKISFRNENFLLYDGVENDGVRFILFATPRQLNILSRSSNIYFNSTFKSVPEIFYQLFVIYREYNKVLIPCVFALMERKTEIMYRRVWEKVRENVEITCQTAMCDFDKASINSFIFFYPSTPLTGYFFHFSQCIWRRNQSGGQSTLYRDNETARSIFKMFAAFASIKEDNVIQAYEALEEHICLNNFEKQFIELLNYYEDTFIGRHDRTGRS